MGDNSEFIGEFLVESTENLDQLDRDLLALEAEPGDSQRLASIFRTVHTIKGNSGFFGFSRLGALAHSGEHLLGRLRTGTLSLDDRITGTLYSMVDAVRSILREIEETGTEGQHDFRDLAQQLAAVAAEESPVADERSGLEPEWAQTASTQVTADVARPETTAAAPPAMPAPSIAPQASPSVDPTVRVDVGLLASILDLVGELVLARNELRSIETLDPAVHAASQRISSVTTALQETAVKTRMLPVEHVFSRFPRTVRDLAKACGKDVVLTIDGADTELDRTLVEAIRDPLTHLIRNAVDHGIEAPEDRVAAGKPSAGTLSLRAYNESGLVTIEVIDDGKGIDVGRVREKAVARGLVSATAAASLSDDDVLQFIFEPGFSTASTVTSVSGRGVGMDVVRTNIVAIGGTIDLQSRSGLGTTVRVHVPLTLAIMPALVVHCAGERFAIPQEAVRELVPVRRPAGESRIEGLADAPVIRIRGRLLPLVFLDAFMALRPQTRCRAEGTIVIVRADDREFGIVVDGSTRAGEPLAGCRDLLEAASLSTIVVKPIGGVLSSLGIYSGATVLGDGHVVLILDVRGLARSAEMPPIDHEPEARPEGGTAHTKRYVVCRTRSGRHVALALDGVVRLERHLGETIEAIGPRHALRRDASFTPLEDADGILGVAVAGGSPVATEPVVNVVVVRGRDGDVGLAVERILDVGTAESPPQGALSVPGTIGTVSIGGLATEVIDIASLAASL